MERAALAVDAHTTLKATLVAFTGSAALNTFIPTAWVPAGVFLVALLLLMSIDLWMCYRIANRDTTFSWQTEIGGKLFLVALVVVSFIMDVVLFVAARYMPQQIPLLDNGWLIVTLASELWLIGSQVTAITSKVALQEGNENIPPHLYVFVKQIQSVFRGLRKVDEERMRKLHKEDAAFKRHDRWYDTGDDDDELARAFVEFMDARRRGATLPPQLDPEQESVEGT